MANEASESAAEFEVPENMIVYYLGLLLRGPVWTPQETPEVERLWEAHMANIHKMEAAGSLVIAGPMLDDGYLRGIYIFRAGSLEEARKLTETDPSVQAGRLAFELHPWMIPRGVLPE